MSEYRYLVLDGIPYEGYSPRQAYATKEEAIERAKELQLHDDYNWFEVVDLSLLDGKYYFGFSDSEGFVFSTERNK